MLLLSTQFFAETFKSASGVPLADTSNQSSEATDPRQHNFLGAQVSSRQVEQHARAHSADREVGVNPAHQPENLKVIELPIPQIGNDVAAVSVSGFLTQGVAQKDFWVDLKLLCDMLHHDSRHLDRIGQESP